jgi:hypothetical protein
MRSSAGSAQSAERGVNGPQAWSAFRIRETPQGAPPYAGLVPGGGERQPSSPPCSQRMERPVASGWRDMCTRLGRVRCAFCPGLFLADLPISRIHLKRDLHSLSRTRPQAHNRRDVALVQPGAEQVAGGPVEPGQSPGDRKSQAVPPARSRQVRARSRAAGLPTEVRPSPCFPQPPSRGAGFQWIS